MLMTVGRGVFLWICCARPQPFFFFSSTSTTEFYTLSLHDALPISGARTMLRFHRCRWARVIRSASGRTTGSPRSEEHTSELQSHSDLVCRLLPEKKKRERGLQEIQGEQENEHRKN